MTATLIHLGIFDDGDVAPTCFVMLFETDDTPEWLYVRLRAAAAELREVAEKAYGRKVPDHALFWHAEPEPSDVD